MVAAEGGVSTLVGDEYEYAAVATVHLARHRSEDAGLSLVVAPMRTLGRARRWRLGSIAATGAATPAPSTSPVVGPGSSPASGWLRPPASPPQCTAVAGLARAANMRSRGCVSPAPPYIGRLPPVPAQRSCCCASTVPPTLRASLLRCGGHRGLPRWGRPALCATLASAAPGERLAGRWTPPPGSTSASPRNGYGTDDSRWSQMCTPAGTGQKATTSAPAKLAPPLSKLARHRSCGAGRCWAAPRCAGAGHLRLPSPVAVLRSASTSALTVSLRVAVPALVVLAAAGWPAVPPCTRPLLRAVTVGAGAVPRPHPIPCRVAAGSRRWPRRPRGAAVPPRMAVVGAARPGAHHAGCDHGSGVPGCRSRRCPESMIRSTSR